MKRRETMGSTRYDNGSTTALQITDPESGERLTIIQSTIFGKSLMFTADIDGTMSSIVVNDADTLRKIKDYLDESIGWMESRK